jgi:long-chain acyl-CoA synthetase
MNLASILEQRAKEHPFRCALIDGRKKLSYRSLNALSNQLASYLIDEAGLKKGDRVGLLHQNSYNYVICFFAILKAGLIVVPINIFLKADEVTFILNDCEVELLIASEKFQGYIESIREKADTLKEILITDAEIKDCGYIPELIKKRPKKNLDIDKEDNDVAAISYTSSTTGSPKGAMLTHNNLFSNAQASMQTINIGPRDRLMMAFPAFHSFMMTVCIVLPISACCPIIILESIRPFERFIKTLIFKRITLLIGIPQLFKVMSNMKLPFTARLMFRFNNLKLCISGSAPLDKNVVAVFEKRFHTKLREGYGLTESSPVVSLNPPLGVNKLGSVGKPLPEVEVKIVDNEEMELPAGEVGELIVKGPNVMRGYYNMPVETAQVIKGGWLFTGDLAKMDSDGYIYIVDRKKDLVISHGMNIYPREIEEVIELNHKVKEAAVIGIKNEKRGEVPMAIVVPKEEQQIDAAEVIAYCKPRLANFKIPHRVEIRSDLPKTPTGKVLKRILKQEYQ